MIASIMALFSGNLLANYLPIEYSVTILISVAAICIVCCILNLRVLLLVLCFAFGIFWTWFNHYDINLPQTYLVIGKISHLPQKKSRAQQFDFKSHQLCPEDFAENQTKCQSSSILLRLRWYGKAPELIPGDLWRLKIRLTKYGSHTSKPFGYVKPSDLNKLLRAAEGFSIDGLRYSLLKRMQQQTADLPHRAFIPALSIGDRQAINPEQWRLFRRTGTNHLMAISGLHIGLVAGVMFNLVNFFWRRWPYLSLQLAASRAASIGAIFAALFYSLLAGFAISTQRALIMIALSMLAVFCKKDPFTLRGFCLALLIIILLDPGAIYNLGFILSFSAVAVILIGMHGRLRSYGFFSLIRLQVLLLIGLLPINLWIFHQFSLIALFANLIAVPIVGLIVVPIVLLGCLCELFVHQSGMICWQLANWVLDWLWWVLAWMNSLPLVWHWQTIDFMSVAGLCFACVLFLLPRGFPGRYLAICGLLPLFLAAMQAIVH